MELRIDAERRRSQRGMRQLLDALGAGEGLTRFVGGSVRDELLGLAVSDIDLATRLHPEEVVERLRAARIKAVPTGIDHGTVTAVVHGEPHEVTTLRCDVSTDGRRAIVEYTDDWKTDAARRDFTINALSADPISGEVYDYFGGAEDLKARRVRFIGDPLQRIAEDHLRILRFFRFHARFGRGAPDPEGLHACTARAKDLMALSRERIADELLKILGLPDPSPTLEIMFEQDILKPVLPEIGMNDLGALIRAETEGGIVPDALRRLVALIPPDPELAEGIAARLKLSNKARKRIACAADRGVENDPEALAYYRGTVCAIDRLLLAGRSDEARALAGWSPPRLPIGGGILIERGMTAGPDVARTLRHIEAQWVEQGFPSGDRLEQIIAKALSERR